MPGGRGGAGRGVGPRREREDRGRRRLQHRGQLRRRAAGARLNPLASCAGRGRGPGRGEGAGRGARGPPWRETGEGRARGEEKGEALPVWAPPLRPLPPPEPSRAGAERGSAGRGTHNITRDASQPRARDARTPSPTSRAGGDGAARETPRGDASPPPRPPRHTDARCSPTQSGRGRKGRARTFRLGARAGRDTPPRKEVQAEGHPRTTAPRQREGAADPRGEERGQQRPRGVTRGGKTQLQQGGRVTARARPPQTGPGTAEGGGVGRRSSDMQGSTCQRAGREGEGGQRT